GFRRAYSANPFALGKLSLNSGLWGSRISNTYPASSSLTMRKSGYVGLYCPSISYGIVNDQDLREGFLNQVIKSSCSLSSESTPFSQLFNFNTATPSELTNK